MAVGVGDDCRSVAEVRVRTVAVADGACDVRGACRRVSDRAGTDQALWGSSILMGLAVSAGFPVGGS
jgi:hypothetical protein